MESCVAMAAILRPPPGATYTRLLPTCLLLLPFVDDLLGRTAHYVATNADHHDIEQRVLNAFGDVAGGKAEPVGDYQASKYDHEQRTPVALQPASLSFGQDDLRLGLQLRAFGLDELPLDLELQPVGLVLVLDHVIDDVQYLATNGSYQVPNHVKPQSV